jgi:DeoR family transcriptional regulator, aga operon transcriptional repressor
VIPAQRRAKILELVQGHGTVSMQELAQTFTASSSTIRRDLDYLAENGYVERTHGGAHRAGHPFGTTFEPEYDIERHTRALEKQAIGRAAADLIRHGSCVFFDSSTTVLEAAKALVANERAITAVTNDLNIAMHLARSSAIRTIVPGGTVRTRSYSLVGSPGNEFMAGMNVDIALVGIHSLADGVLSDSSLEIVQSKRTTMATARHCVLLADSSKFKAPRSFLTVAPLASVDTLVTDGAITEDEHRRATEAGVSVHVAVVGR